MSWHVIQRIKDYIDTVDAEWIASGTGATIVEDTATATPKIASPASSGTANTFGSWVAIDSSTAADYWLCGCSISVPARGAALSFVVQLGIGATEAAKWTKSFYYGYKSDVGYLPPVEWVFPSPIKIDSGTKISVRVADSEANANTLKIGLNYYATI